MREYLDILSAAGDLPARSWAPDDPLIAAELADQVFMNLAQGYFMYLQSSAEHPDFGPLYNSVMRLQPNPDDVYCRAHLDDDGVYRITGERGTVRLLTFTLAELSIGMAEKPGGQTAEYDLDQELQFDSAGCFDVILSASRPQGYDGDWLHLPPGTKSLITRQRSYDWANERDARFAIERLDRDALKERTGLDELQQRLTGLAEYAERHSRQWLQYQDQMRLDGLINRVAHHGFSDLGGIRVQVYWWGMFELAADEALIIETDVPEDAPYWNIQLNDQIWNTLEYVWRQSSLNGHQACLDSDGRFRGVISLADPGVPNWLDPVGRTQGSIVGRWYRCDSNPVPNVRRVRFDQLRDHLPGDTPVVTAKERDQQIRARARSAQYRRRW